MEQTITTFNFKSVKLRMHKTTYSNRDLSPINDPVNHMQCTAVFCFKKSTCLNNIWWHTHLHKINLTQCLSLHWFVACVVSVVCKVLVIMVKGNSQ